MQLGFVSAILSDLSLAEVLAFAAEEQYDCVEVMCWPAGGKDRKYGGVTHIDVEGLDQPRADEVLALCERSGVSISAIGYYPNPLSANQEEAETAGGHLQKVIDAAPLLGLDTVNTFIGADHSLPMAVNLERFAQVWPELVRYAEDRGVRIAIENCPMLSHSSWLFGSNLARSPHAWRQMFETIPSPNFGLNLDPSHLVMTHIDPIQPIYDFADRIFHTHAKDMKIDVRRLNEFGSLECADLAKWGVAKISGLGDVDWNRWVSALTDIGYDGPVCVEVEDESFTATLEGRQKSLQISRNVLRGLVV